MTVPAFTFDLPGPATEVPAWADVDALTEQVRKAAGMVEGDKRVPDLKPAVEASAMLVDTYLGVGTFTDTAPLPVTQAVGIVALEMYRRRDAAFGVLNVYAGTELGPVRVSTDWLKGVESLLAPYRTDFLGVW